MKNYLIILITCLLYTNAFSQLQLAIEVDTSQGCAPLLCTFTGSGDSSITSWHWIFNNGDTSNLQNPSHSYDAIDEYTPGLYTITLIASNGSIADTLIMAALISVYPKPIANFSVSPLSSSELSFTNLTLSASQWNWSFGDGNFSNVQNPTHDYGTTGAYDVTLVVQNLYTCMDTITISDIFNYTGIEQQVETPFSTTIFPNPVQRFERLGLTSNKALDYVEITDITGRILQQFTFRGGRTLSIPIEVLAKGIYICRLTDENGSVMARKFLVE